MVAYLDGKQWRWRRQIKLPTGERRRLSGTPEINTKRAALEAEHDEVEEALAGRRVGPESPTLAAVRDDYLKHVRMQRSPSLADNRTSQMDTHLIPFFGRTRLDRIDLKMWDEYKLIKLAGVPPKVQPLMPSTINQHLFALSNLLRWAQKRGKLRTVPAFEKLPVPHASLDEVEFLSDEEEAAILAKAKGDLRAMIVVALQVGLRAGELLALRWADVDWVKRRVTVRHNLYKGKDRPPKGKRSRHVPLTRTAYAALESVRHLRGEFVFCEDDGRPYVYATALWRAQEVGLPGWHLCRHTFGTRLSARGVPLRAIQEWLGHADIKTTMVYAHFSPVLDEAIHVLDQPKTWQAGANVLAPMSDTDGAHHA